MNTGMKMIGIAAVALISLVGCGRTGEPAKHEVRLTTVQEDGFYLGGYIPPTPVPTPPATPEPTQTPAPKPELVRVGDYDTYNWCKTFWGDKTQHIHITNSRKQGTWAVNPAQYQYITTNGNSEVVITLDLPDKSELKGICVSAHAKSRIKIIAKTPIAGVALWAKGADTQFDVEIAKGAWLRGGVVNLDGGKGGLIKIYGEGRILCPTRPKHKAWDKVSAAEHGTYICEESR